MPSVSSDENLRIAALERYLVLDTAAEQSFDRLTAFAAATLEMPLAFICLIDKSRQWFKSCFGMNLQQTGRDEASCHFIISSAEVVVVTDTQQDERFTDSPLVTGEPHIRFIAAMPLQTKDGYTLGALCVADTEPCYSFTRHQQKQLAELAYFVMELLENRLVTQVLKNELVVQGREMDGKLTESEKRYLLLAQNSKDIILVTSPDGTLLYISPACYAVLNFLPEEYVGQSVYKFVHDDDLGKLQNAYTIALKTSKILTSAFRFRAKDGHYVWLEVATHTIFDPVTREAIEIHCSCRDISRRKAAEDALKESETNYRALYLSANRQAQEFSLLHKVRNSLSQTMELPDLLQKIVEAVVQEFGYTHVAIFLLQGDTLVLQEQFGHLYNETSFSIDRGVNGRVVRTGKPAFVPDVLSDPDFISGQIDIVSEISVPLFDQEKVVGTLNIESTQPGELTVDDLRILEALGGYISLALHRSRLNAEVIKSAQWLQTVVNNAPLILFTMDAEGKFTFSAGKGLADLGLKPNQSLGLPVFDVYADNPQVIADARRVLAGESFSSLVEIGGMVFDSYYTPIKDDTGKVISVIGVSTDVTKRNQAEKALQRQQDFALQVMGNMGQGLTVLDPVNFTIRYTNPAFAKMVGYPIEELTGKNPFDLIPENYHARLRDECLIQLDGTGNNNEIELIKKDGRLIYVNVSSEGIYQEGKLRGLIVVSTDLTERKRVEQGLQLALVREKELGELKDRLIMTASHEFRTPLSAIISSAELLEFYSHKWSEEKKLEILGRISISARKLTNLVEDILVYNRAESGHLECVRAELDLSSFCTRLVEELQLSTEENKVVRLVERGESQKAFLDKKLLGYILNNLLSNALKYSPPGSEVVLELDWKNGEVVFQVIDQGIGIPLKDQPHLFEPFRRASNVGNINGSGFGLAIVKRSLIAHGGEISLRSFEGVGTTFTVILPLSASEINESPDLHQAERANSLDSESSSNNNPEITEQIPPNSSMAHWWLLERAIEASSSGIIITDPTRESNPLIYVSKGFIRMTGFLSEEILGHPFTFLQGDDQEQAELEELRLAQLEGRDCRVVLRSYRKNGSLFWSELQLSAVSNQAGKMTYFVGILTDVSDRVKAQQALDKSERRFKALVENTPDTIAQFDRQGRYLYISPGMIKTSQGTLTPERVIGKAIDEVGLSEERVAAFQKQLKEVLETGKVGSYEVIQNLPGKGIEYYQIQMAPEFNQDGKEVISVLTIGRDITELKLANKALQAAQTRASEILGSIINPFFAVDSNWKFTYLNQPAEKLLGRTQPELIGRDLWEEFPEEITSFYRKKDQFGKPEMVVFELEEYFPVLQTWFETHAFPLEGGGFSFYFQDITSRKELEEKLKQSELAYRHLMEQVAKPL